LKMSGNSLSLNIVYPAFCDVRMEQKKKKKKKKIQSQKG